LVYIVATAPTDATRELVWVDRNGREAPIEHFPPTALSNVRISPDGSRAAFTSTADVWTWTFATGVQTRLTNDVATQYNPLWASNSALLFDSGEPEGRRIVRRSADGTGDAVVVVPAPAGYPDTLSRDGKLLVFHTQPRVAMLVALGTNTPPTPLVSETAQTSDAEISPDGQWVAYESDVSGRFEVYVRPFPGVDKGREQISPAGGQHPLWSRNGKELFFIAADGKLMAVPVQLGTSFHHDRPVPLFPAQQYYVNVARDYDVSPDGRQFLFVKPATQASVPPARIAVALNWFDELKRLAPAK
jgi:Tol biopolymer transport system component